MSTDLCVKHRLIENKLKSKLAPFLFVITQDFAILEQWRTALINDFILLNVLS